MRWKKFLHTVDKNKKDLWNIIVPHRTFWYMGTFIFLQECTQSILILLSIFYSDTPNLPITLAELIILSIAGWALFTMILRVDSTSLIPLDTIRKNRVEQQKLVNAMFFVPSTRILVRMLVDIFTGNEIFKVLGAGANI